MSKTFVKRRFFCYYCNVFFRNRGDNLPDIKISKMYCVFITVIVASVVFCFLSAEPKIKADNITSSGNASSQTEKDELSEKIDAITESGEFTYGLSGLDQKLICTKIAPKGESKHKILIGFEIHGYEDHAPKDGQALVDMAKTVIKHFEENRSELENSELYIIASLNPDGLASGSTNNGPGRCQISKSIDLNRDFDYAFKAFDESRNHTLKKPFSAPESKAVKELVETIKPDVVIDCHGWGEMFIGNTYVSDCFAGSLGITYSHPFNGNCCGFFSAWADNNGAKGLLIEYPPAAYDNTSGYAAKTCEGIKKLAVKLS